MKVPLLDLKAQFQQIDQDLRAEIDDVLTSQQFINGPKVSQLESELAEYLKVEHAIGVSSGTDALLVAMMALQIEPGDLVLTTPYSFFATAGCISRLGATPIFIDIDARTYNLCPQKLEEWLAKNPSETSRVKACILVHLYGQAAAINEIKPLLDAHSISLIEDAAQAIGAQTLVSNKDIPVGGIGDLGCFSFFPSKNLGGIGDGGLVVSNNTDLADRVRKLKNHGSHPKYYHEFIGGNFRLDAIQAAALLAKLPHLDGWHQARQHHAAVYDENFSDLDEIQCPELSGPREHHIYNQYVVRAENRDALREHLHNQQIGSEIYYPLPFHMQACFASLGYKQGDFPIAESAAQETLALPVYPELSPDAQSYVIQAVQEFYA